MLLFPSPLLGLELNMSYKFQLDISLCKTLHKVGSVSIASLFYDQILYETLNRLGQLLTHPAPKPDEVHYLQCHVYTAVHTSG